MPPSVSLGDSGPSPRSDSDLSFPVSFQTSWAIPWGLHDCMQRQLSWASSGAATLTAGLLQSPPHLPGPHPSDLWLYSHGAPYLAWARSRANSYITLLPSKLLQACNFVTYRRTTDVFFFWYLPLTSTSSRQFCHVVLEMTRSRWKGAWSRLHFPSGTIYF